MGMFIGEVVLKPDPATKKWEVVEEFSYVKDKDSVYKIPSEFPTDGASIPRFFWRIIGHPYEARVVRAAIVHDFLYRDKHVQVTKSEADLIFRDILEMDGVGKIRRNLMYYAVKSFGGFAFQEKTPKTD